MRSAGTEERQGRAAAKPRSCGLRIAFGEVNPAPSQKSLCLSGYSDTLLAMEERIKKEATKAIDEAE